MRRHKRWAGALHRGRKALVVAYKVKYTYKSNVARMAGAQRAMAEATEAAEGQELAHNSSPGLATSEVVRNMKYDKGLSDGPEHPGSRKQLRHCCILRLQHTALELQTSCWCADVQREHALRCTTLHCTLRRIRPICAWYCTLRTLLQEAMAALRQ